ncbi:MAG: hypothetical protein M3Z85_07570 [Acidobacteriota bacterium]|nr:hypothetical protein [Acidobacteriota bacterium]
MRRLFALLCLFSTTLLGQTTLQQYLSLSGQQASAIVSLNIEFQRYDVGKQQRVNTVKSELADLYSQPSADPTALGVRYVELEAIRRDIAAHATTLRSQADAVLTPIQLPRLQTLRNDAQLQALLNDARCAFLVAAAPASQWFNPAGFGVITGVLIVDPASAPQLPYIPPAPSATFCGSMQFPLSTLEYFSLTEDQVSAIASASARYNDLYTRKQNRIQELQIEIRDETAKETQNPVQLGVRYAELQSIGLELQKAQDGLRQEARATLTGPQTAKLKALDDAASLQPAVSQALGCNLIEPPPASNYFFPNYCQSL